MIRNKIAGLLSGLLIFSTTSYLLLDTFVIPSTYQTNASSESSTDAFATALSNASSSSATTSTATTSTADLESIGATVTKTYDTYDENGVKITVTEYTYLNTEVYVASITLDSAESLKSAFANNSFGKNITAKTSTIASENDAILAINGDYYGAQETGVVTRNGVVYRDDVKSGSEILCIYADGTMKIVSSDDFDSDELVKKGVWQAYTFGPGLVENGEVSVSSSDEVGKAMASNPRTAIGQTSANNFTFVVSDGRTSESEGLSLKELATFMQALGCTTAYNLDGGGSSTMYYNGTVINNPTTTGRISERSVSDIIYVK